MATGEPTLTFHLDAVFRHLASPVVKKALSILSCENSATKLRRMLLRVQAVLADADDRHPGDPSVQAWMLDLKSALLAADDVFDDLVTRFLLVGDSPDFARSDFGTRIAAVGERLDEIAKESVGLGLNEMVGDKFGRGGGRKERGGNGRVLVGEACVFNRDVDRERIVEMLLKGESKRKDFDVVSVVGMGGLGKTTLARVVFDDERVEGYFMRRIWVSVCEGFDARRIMKAIIESATGERYLLLGVEAMQRNLRTILAGKRILIVLDDVQDENCSEWEKLAVPLSSGAHGSKVLLTTSSEAVARVVGSVSTYHLKGLSNEDCWSLFRQHAFGDGNLDTDLEMVMIGKEIVKKCRGSPLAVKALGSLLHTKKDEYEWRRILKNQIWNVPMKNKVYFPALWLSYLHLPLHLKQCFMYCSMLPKNVKFGKNHLVRLWMAQGYILPKGNTRMEDLGKEYFDDLLWRSFFQHSHYDHEDNETKYVMHEVMHDFAHFVSGRECFLLYSEDLYDIPKNTCHLSLNSSKLETLSVKAFSESCGIRSFVLTGECKLHEWKVPNDLFLKLSCLRVLDLSNTSLQLLPESVGSLIHLRYLSLFGTQIQELPESLGNLYNLQTLDLGDCFKLKGLPKGMKNLINLRHLNLKLHQCKVSGLSPFPAGFGQLTCLQTLSLFVVGKKSQCKIDELKDLVDLEGQLCISKLENVASEDEAEEADLKGKQHIRKLELQWNLNPKADKDMQEKVLNNLQPHININELTIRGFAGSTLPSWIGDSFFFNLVTVSLSDCLECRLPPLGQLPSLKFLCLERVEVKVISQEFRGNCKSVSFPCLETLKFDSLPQWEEWSGLAEGDMPCLQELTLIGCSKLRTLPGNMFALKKLETWNCFRLSSLPRLPSLTSLVLRCPTNTVLETLHKLTSLCHLEIKNCPELTSLPKNLPNLSSLKELVIHDCKQLNVLLEGLKNLTALEYLEISGCPQLSSFPKGGFPPGLKFLSIFTSPSLGEWCQNNENWGSLTQDVSVCVDGQQVQVN